jgi:cytoskeletal protein RodZ
MSTVAEQLRAAREAKKMTVNQVADITKIRTDHIRALEEGNFDMFSAPVYIRGFVRNYATLLKMDVPKTMATLDAELKETEKFSEPPPLSDEPKTPLDFIMLQLTKVDWRKGLIGLGAIFGIIVLLLAIIGVRRSLTREPAPVKPGVYHPARTNTGETLPVPPPGRRR